MTTVQRQGIMQWVNQHKLRLLGTGMSMTSWCLVTWPSPSLWQAKLHHIYGIGARTPIGPQTEGLISDVAMDINLERPFKGVDLNKYKWFLGRNPFPTFQHRGNIRTSRVYIVLPEGFQNPQLSRLVRKEIYDKMVLPEIVQKYAIAREFLYAESDYEITRCIVGLVCIAMYSLLSYRTLRVFASPNSIAGLKNILKLEHIEDKIAYRIQNFVRIPFLSLGLLNIYWAVICHNSRAFERKTDQFIATLGPEYVKGGAMFYKMALDLNRKKSRGGVLYPIDKNGEFQTGRIHKKTLPYSARLKFFEEQMESERQKKEQDAKLLVKNAPVVEKQT